VKRCGERDHKRGRIGLMTPFMVKKGRGVNGEEKGRGTLEDKRGIQKSKKKLRCKEKENFWSRLRGTSGNIRSGRRSKKKLIKKKVIRGQKANKGGHG